MTTLWDTGFECKCVWLSVILWFCARQNTSFVATEACLSRQTYFCQGKTFVATNISRDKHNFGCSGKLTFVATKICLFRQNLCCDKHVFAVRNICCDKRFVATEMLLMASPASDARQPCIGIVLQSPASLQQTSTCALPKIINTNMGVRWFSACRLTTAPPTVTHDNGQNEGLRR